MRQMDGALHGSVLVSVGYNAQIAQDVLNARDAQTYGWLWQRAIAEPLTWAYLPPTTFIFLDQDGTLHGNDLRTGTERWRMPFPDWPQTAAFYSSNFGQAPGFFGTAAQGAWLYWDAKLSPQQARAYAFQFAASPAVKWQFDGSLLIARTWQGTSYPVQGDRSIFGITNTNQLMAVDPQTGALRWKISTASFGALDAAIDLP